MVVVATSPRLKAGAYDAAEAAAQSRPRRWGPAIWSADQPIDPARTRDPQPAPDALRIAILLCGCEY
jgi:hypothetical protein